MEIVFGKELISSQNPLLQVKNPNVLVLTLHFTRVSLETRPWLLEKVGQNIEEFLNGVADGQTTLNAEGR